MKYKATIPGTENVLIGTEWAPFDRMPVDRAVGGTFTIAGETWQTVTLYFSAGWQVEPIIELPTKRDAVVRINDNAYWRSAEAADNPWVDTYGNPWSDKGVLASAAECGGFEVIFEGLDDPA